MFVVVFLVILALSLMDNYLKIKKHTRHDKYLYKFCHLRREIMSYLAINHDVISNKEYQATKQVIDVLNNTINLYSKNQASNLFNIRKFAKFVKKTKHLSDSSKKLIECDNNIIKDFRDKLNRNIILTFFAYTPFIFAEIIFKLLYLVGRFFVRVQVLKFKKLGKRLLKLNEDFNSINSSKKELMA